MDKTLKRGVATIYQRAGRLLQCFFKGTATKNEYKKYVGLIYAKKDTLDSDLGTIQPPMKNPTRVFRNTPCTRWESKP